jgi:hypothetical protein
VRILITGSREWTDESVIRSALEKFTGNHTLISGNARGADALCEKVAKELGWDVELYPADWDSYGKKAGFIRNFYMITECSPDICIGFILNKSRGASMTIDLAVKHNVKIEVHQINV